ncbi:MFS transporter [Variovorax sp. HJSM1_2]|uniref:MFS transporter n=1 Tax=Variovorax sp. HJSM1_2 TaxID=3366263 RepID=UPI003BCBDB80
MSQTLTSIASPDLSSARWGVRTLFFFAGLMFATWGVHIPTVKALYGLNEADLGLLILAAGLGAVTGLLGAGFSIARFGARRMVWICGGVTALALAGLVSMPGFGALMVLLAVFGLCSSTMDVAMNAEASELERLEGRPQMSGYHGMFSAGGMAGAGIGSALLSFDVMPSHHLWGVTTLSLLAIGWAGSTLLPPAPHEGEASHFRVPHGVLLMLGLMGALGFVVEGAMYDWSVLFVKQEVGASQNVAALAYAGFSAAMAVTRFGGDWLRARFSSATLLRASAGLAAAGMVFGVLASHPLQALVGFAIVGVGLANVVPVLFSAAARAPGVTPAHGIASVASLGYMGFMVGPPIVGFVAHLSSLTVALFAVAMLAVIMAVVAPRAVRQVA